MENTNYLTLSRNIGSTVKRRLLKALKKTGQSISSSSTPKLKNANAYLRMGYSRALLQVLTTLPLIFVSRDIRAIENTGMEICEIAKGAADYMIEARKGSDFYNLLAYPVLRFSGGIFTDLSGADMGYLKINPEDQYDFIACANRRLLVDIMETINSFHKKNYFESGEYIFEIRKRHQEDFKK